ncbi:hypothetical protein Tco_0893511 [Tanacetum coccineum]|uniref:Uncharacterized protein n=1 Tax=Tanacetum coccineum TaxID=301880 RepID=A0ABQ5CFC0_9ASTR
MATLNETSPQENGSGSSPRCQDTLLGDAEAQTRLKLKELMDLYTKLSDRVLDLGTTKTAQAKEIASLKKRVKKLERKRKSKTPRMNLFKIDMDEVFIYVEGDAEQVISAAADEVPTGDVVNTAGTEVNTASALVTTAGVSLSTAEPITTASVNITTAEPFTPPPTTTIFEDEDLQQESAKKQKMDDDKEKEELKQCFEIIPDDGDDVTIDATPLIVKARFKKTKLMDYMDTFLLLTLKIMFEHHVEDEVWKRQQGLVKVLKWKLFDSCGVHCVTIQSIMFYLLVEKMYPHTNHTLHQMFNDVKLQVDYECEIAFDLLRLVKKQLKEGYVPE